MLPCYTPSRPCALPSGLVWKGPAAEASTYVPGMSHLTSTSAREPLPMSRSLAGLKPGTSERSTRGMKGSGTASRPSSQILVDSVGWQGGESRVRVKGGCVPSVAGCFDVLQCPTKEVHRHSRRHGTPLSNGSGAL